MTDEAENPRKASDEPHDVREARKIIAKPHDPQAEKSMMRIMAEGLIRYYEAGRPTRRSGMGGEPGIQRMT